MKINVFPKVCQYFLWCRASAYFKIFRGPGLCSLYSHVPLSYCIPSILYRPGRLFTWWSVPGEIISGLQTGPSPHLLYWAIESKTSRTDKHCTVVSHFLYLGNEKMWLYFPTLYQERRLKFLYLSHWWQAKAQKSLQICVVSRRAFVAGTH